MWIFVYAAPIDGFERSGPAAITAYLRIGLGDAIIGVFALESGADVRVVVLVWRDRRTKPLLGVRPPVGMRLRSALGTRDVVDAGGQPVAESRP